MNGRRIWRNDNRCGYFLRRDGKLFLWLAQKGARGDDAGKMIANEEKLRMLAKDLSKEFPPQSAGDAGGVCDCGADAGQVPRRYFGHQQ